MTITFLIIGIIAGSFLLISSLLNGIFDFLHVDFLDGAIGPTSAAAFLSVFGFSGAFLSSTTGWEIGLTVAVSLIPAFLVFAVVAIVTRFFNNSESGHVDDESIVGKTAMVTLEIPEGGTGRVSVKNSGHNMVVNAKSMHKVLEGTKVIIDSLGSLNLVYVSPINNEDNITTTNKEETGN